MVCGGSPLSKACYSLQENRNWKEDRSCTLKVARYRAGTGSVIVNNRLVLAGGYGSSGALSSIELVAPNTKSQTLPTQIPVATQWSCIVPWDDNIFMVIGGSSGTRTKDTYFVNVNKNTTIHGPKLQIGRFEHACNEIIVNGEAFIIVVGGLGAAYSSTEVISKSSIRNKWKTGKEWGCITTFNF